MFAHSYSYGEWTS